MPPEICFCRRLWSRRLPEFCSVGLVWTVMVHWTSVIIPVAGLLPNLLWVLLPVANKEPVALNVMENAGR